MKYEYIHSIDDIDPSRVSIRDINKRYVDREGNRYATRFNPTTRRVEIVRLASTREEAMELRSQILKERKEIKKSEHSLRHQQNQNTPGSPAQFAQENETEGSSSRNPSFSSAEVYAYDEQGIRYNMNQIDPYADDEFHVPSSVSSSSGSPGFLDPPGKEKPTIEKNPFYESQFLEETSQNLVKIKDRLFAIGNNLKRSRLFETYKGEEFFEISRQIDNEGISGAENAINLYKEITHYPRPLTYYLSRMNEAQKKHIESMESEEKRMEIVKRWELQESFEAVFNTIMNISVDLIRILNEIPDEIMSKLAAQQKTYLDNARTSAELLVEDCNKKIARIEVWKRNHP